MVMRCLVIIPAFNEEASVGAVVDAVQRASADYDVVVVDDGSSDATASKARAAGARVITLPFNLGVGGAMRVGYKLAVAEDYDAAVQVDADGQHDPAEIAALLDALGDHDVVIGARFAGKGDYVARGTRRLAMRVLARSLSRTCGTPLTDVTSGFRAANRRAAAFWAANYPTEYLGDTVESLVMAARAGMRVAQVPVAMRERATGTASQTPLRAAMYFGRALLVLGLARVRRLPEVAR